MINIPRDIRLILDSSTCLYSKADVEAALDRMAGEIDAAISDSFPIFLCVVVGGMIPLGGLLTRVFFPLEVNYIHATRYGGQTQGGALSWKAQPTETLEGRTVLIVDDILDSGLTLQAVVRFCEAQGAQKICTAVLVDKPLARKKEGLQRADFTGLFVEDQYVFGYGMDYRGYLRNAPGIFAISPQHK